MSSLKRERDQDIDNIYLLYDLVCASLVQWFSVEHTSLAVSHQFDISVWSHLAHSTSETLENLHKETVVQWMSPETGRSCQ